MNLNPDSLPGLRNLLDSFDGMAEALGQHNALIPPADLAAANMRARVADLDRQAAELAAHHIPADPDRITRLIAGVAVPEVDRKEIEARAHRAQVIAALRHQAAEDAAALQAHVDTLNATAAAMRQGVIDAERAFLVALADAVREAYKQNAIAFIEANVPALHSVIALMRSRIGEVPAWVNRILPGISISWREEEQIPDPVRPGTGYMIHKPVSVWPRPGEVLMSGKAAASGDLADALIMAVRAFDAPAAGQPQA
jgi:hypothetical protein